MTTNHRGSVLVTDNLENRVIRCSEPVAKFMLGLRFESYDDDGELDCGLTCVTYAEAGGDGECRVKLSSQFVEYLATGTFDWGDGEMHDDVASPLKLVYRQPVDATEMFEFLYGSDFAKGFVDEDNK
jgi:hypothetical protein